MKKYKRIILCGPAAAGKDWSREYLEQLGYIYATSYTSRPKRPGEVDGEDYHFLTNEEFADMIDDGLFYEYIRFGAFYYGTTNVQMKECSLFIMTPGGISLLKPEDRTESLVVYLNPHTDIRRARLTERNDDISKSQKRIDLDKIEFDNFTDFDVEFTNPETMRDDFDKLNNDNI